MKSKNLQYAATNQIKPEVLISSRTNSSHVKLPMNKPADENLRNRSKREKKGGKLQKGETNIPIYTIIKHSGKYNSILRFFYDSLMRETTI